jgi:hypothetical protein
VGFRFGHRTIQGIVNDGFNALQRYYLNNFCDGTKQVCRTYLTYYVFGKIQSLHRIRIMPEMCL